MFLMVVAVLNLLVSLGALAAGASFLNLSDEELTAQVQRTWDTYPEWAKEFYREQGVTRDNLATTFRQSLPGFTAWSAMGVAFGVLSFLGGLWMRRLRGYPLALTGSILVAIPCLSPLSFCLMGEGVGIWCLVVLLSGDVKAAFGVPRPPEPEDQWPRRHG